MRFGLRHLFIVFSLAAVMFALMATMGGAWLTLLHGFAGLKVVDDAPSFRPRLPPRWRRLRFKLAWRGRLLEVDSDRHATSYRLLAGEALVVWARAGGRPHRIEQIVAGKDCGAEVDAGDGAARALAEAILSDRDDDCGAAEALLAPGERLVDQRSAAEADGGRDRPGFD